MKQAVPLVIVVGCVGLAVGFWLGSRPQAVPTAVEATKAQLIQAAMKPAAGEKIVHTFADQAAMEAFISLWQQRQQRLLRMATLEGYWNNEQATLGDLNSQLTSQYSLDLAKEHVLNTDERVLMEQERPAATGGEAAAPTEAVPPADAPAAGETATAPDTDTGERKVIYTFADDAAMQAFAQLWQQRQSILLRMAVLKAYWDSEQQLVTQLNETLATTYQVDVAKAYTLDDQRLVLVEREAPQAPTPAAAPTQDAGTAQTGEQAATPAPQTPAPAQGGTPQASN